jgi:putative nucleotidyltransferase with HDIG domain
MFGTSKRSARRGRLSGRLRSPRDELVPLPALGRKAWLARAGLAVATAVALTAVTAVSAPPLPYQAGEISDIDFRARVAFAVVDEAQTNRLREQAVERRTVPNLAEAHRTIAPALEQYSAGTVLLKRGEPISEAQIALLSEEARGYQESLGLPELLRRHAARFAINFLLCVLVALYIVRFQAAVTQNLPRMIGMSVQAVITVALALLLARSPWQAQSVPLTVTAMVFTLAFNAPFALLMSFCLALVCTVAAGIGVGPFLVQMGGLATVVLILRDVRTRARLVQVSATAGVAFAAMTAATGLAGEQSVRWVGFDAGRQLLWALLAGFILSGMLPLIERLYGIVTDVTLLELADTSHPLLQELVRRAPGTYTHSMTMAALAESAAEAIGANPLLARVGCYYHDIGKMLKPQYFIENQNGDNRHDRLEPALSTLIIIGHVKDGAALAEQYRLPGAVIDFIQQHHGTTLVEYFYRQALRLQEENGHGGELEYAFRYPGPKPRSRESGIVMLADALESASRALTAPTPNSLRKLVHDLVMKRLLDGQFDDSGLTLTELNKIEESLAKSVIAVYHSRISYPPEMERAAA